MKRTNLPVMNEKEFTVEYWRERYLTLKKSIKGVPIQRALIEADAYYNTIEGTNDLKNVMKATAGLNKTRSIVITLEAYIQKQKSAVNKRSHLSKLGKNG